MTRMQQPGGMTQFGNQGFQTAPRMLLPTDAQMRQHEQFMAANAPQTSFIRGIGDAIRSEWVTSFLPSLIDRFDGTQGTFELDPETLRELGQGIDEELWDEFAYARTMDDALKTRDRLMRLSQARERLSEMGWTGVGLQLAAAVLDPAFIVAGSFAAPAAFAAKGTRLAQMGRAAATIGGVEASLEATASVVDPQRTWVDVIVAGTAAGAFSAGGAWWSAYRLTKRANRAKNVAEAQGTAIAAVEDLIRRSPGLTDEQIQNKLTDLGLHDATPDEVRREFKKGFDPSTLTSEELSDLAALPDDALPDNVRPIAVEMRQFGGVPFRMMNMEEESLQVIKEMADEFDESEFDELFSAEKAGELKHILAYIRDAKPTLEEYRKAYPPTQRKARWKHDQPLGSGLKAKAKKPDSIIAFKEAHRNPDVARQRLARFLSGDETFRASLDPEDVSDLSRALDSALSSQGAAKWWLGIPEADGKFTRADLLKAGEELDELTIRDAFDRQVATVREWAALIHKEVSQAADEQIRGAQDEIRAAVAASELPEDEIADAADELRQAAAEHNVADQRTDVEQAGDVPDELTYAEIPATPDVPVPNDGEAMDIIDLALDDMRNFEAADFMVDDAVIPRSAFARHLREGTYFDVGDPEFIALSRPDTQPAAEIPAEQMQQIPRSVELADKARQDIGAGVEAIANAVEDAGYLARETKAILVLKREIGSRVADLGYATPADVAAQTDEVNAAIARIDDILEDLGGYDGRAVVLRQEADRIGDGDTSQVQNDLIGVAEMVGYEVTRLADLHSATRRLHVDEPSVPKPAGPQYRLTGEETETEQQILETPFSELNSARKIEIRDRAMSEPEDMDEYLDIKDTLIADAQQGIDLDQAQLERMQELLDEHNPDHPWSAEEIVQVWSATGQIPEELLERQKRAFEAAKIQYAREIGRRQRDSVGIDADEVVGPRPAEEPADAAEQVSPEERRAAAAEAREAESVDTTSPADEDEMAALGFAPEPEPEPAPEMEAEVEARPLTPRRTETQRTLDQLEPEELDELKAVQRNDDGEYQGLAPEIRRTARLSERLIPDDEVANRRLAVSALLAERERLVDIRQTARNQRKALNVRWKILGRKFKGGVATPATRLMGRIGEDLADIDARIESIDMTVNRMRTVNDLDPRRLEDRGLVKSDLADARAANAAYHARYISRIDGIENEISERLEDTRQLLSDPELRRPGQTPDDPIEIEGRDITGDGGDGGPPTEPPNPADRFDENALPEQIPRIGESEATRFDRFVNSKLRFSMAAALGRSRSNLTRLAGALLGDDTLMFLRGVENRLSLSEWRTRQIQRRLARFYRVTGPLLIEFASHKAGRKVGPIRAMRSRTQFYELVSRVIRGGELGEQIANEFPPVAKAAEYVREHQKELLRLAKTFRVKGFDGVYEDDEYIMRVWKVSKLDEVQRMYGENALNDFISGAIRNAYDQPLSKKLGDRMAKGLIRKIREVEQARQAGVDPHWMTKSDADLMIDLLEEQRDTLNALVAKNNQGDVTELEQLLEEVQIKIRAARKPDESTPARARRRVRLDETYSYTFPASGTAPSTNIVLSDLLEENAETLLHVYTDQMISNMALRKFHDRIGTESFETLRIRMMEDGATKDEMDKVELLYKSIGGMRIGGTGKLAEAGRLLRAYQYLRVMNQVGFAQLAEIPIAVASGGFSATVASLPTLKKVFKKAQDGELSEELLREIEAIWAAGTDYLRHQPYSRFDGTQQYLGDFGNQLEQKNRVLQKVTASISGFAMVDTALQRMAITIGINKFANIARTGKLPSKKRLSAMGLDEDMARRIVRQIAGDKEQGIEGYARLEDGPLGVSKVTQLNLAYWDDQEAAAAFVNALQIWSKRAVQQNDIGAFSAWMTSDWGKIFIQFRSFVISAWEKQLIYGLAIRDLETWTTFALTSVFAGLAYSAQTFANSVGRNDADEYRRERLSMDAIGKAAFARAGYSSFLPAIADEALLRTGYEPWFSGIRSSQLATSFVSGNPSIDFLNNLTGGVPRAFMAPPISSSYRFSQDDFHNIIRILPFSNALGVKQVVDAVSSPLPETSRVE